MKKACLMAFIATVAVSLNAGEPVKMKILGAASIPGNYSQNFMSEHPDEIPIKVDKYIGINIELEKTVPGKYYRLSLQAKGSNLTIRDIQNIPDASKDSIFGNIYNVSPKWQQMYFYSNPIMLKERKFNWRLDFVGNGEIALKDIKIEQMDQSDLAKNLLPDDGLNPALWWGWCNRDLRFKLPELINVADSPFGDKALKMQLFNEPHAATLALPAVPGAELTVEFWAKMETNSLPLVVRFTDGVNYGSGYLEQGITNEWQKITYSAALPANIGESKSIFVNFLALKLAKTETATIYIGKFDVHYVFSDKTK